MNFRENFVMAFRELWGALGKMLHEQKFEEKISWHCPFNLNLSKSCPVSVTCLNQILEEYSKLVLIPSAGWGGGVVGGGGGHGAWHRWGDRASSGRGSLIRRGEGQVWVLPASAAASYLVLALFRSLLLFLQFSFFLPFSRAIPYKLGIRFSVYIRPVCINALCTWALFADLDLAQLTGFLVCVNPHHDFDLHNNALLFLSLLCRPWSSMTDRISLRESTSRLWFA
jgi:hypothetical protein